MENKKRDMNYELLRIISMILIICAHYITHSHIMEDVDIYSFNYFILEIIMASTRISVGLYILITGYYMVTSKMKLKKLINIWTEIIFYSILILIIYIIASGDFNIKNIIKSFLPISSSWYWFATAYIALYMLTPFINILIKNINKKVYLILLGILFFFLVLQKNIFAGNKVIDSNGGSNLTFFIFLYLIGGYIRLHFDRKINRKLCLYITIATPFINTALKMVALILFNKSLGRLIDFNSIFNFISMICLFLYFKDLKIRSDRVSKVIEKIAPLMFSIYLITDNGLSRNFIWVNIFKVRSFANSPYLLIHFFITIIVIFIVCGIIETIRVKLWNACSKTKMVKKINNNIDDLNQRFWNILEEKDGN